MNSAAVPRLSFIGGLSIAFWAHPDAIIRFHLARPIGSNQSADWAWRAETTPSAVLNYEGNLYLSRGVLAGEPVLFVWLDSWRR